MRTYHSLVALTALALFAAPFATGCTVKTQSNTNTAAAGDEVSQSEADTESFATTFVGTDSNGNVAAAAFSAPGDIRVQGLGLASGGSGASTFPNLSPAGCVNVTVDASSQTNTYAFNDCTGPFGLVHLTGTVDVKWSLSGDALTLDYSAQNFDINSTTLTSWTATAVITASGTARSMTWNASLAGTTPSGRNFTRTNDKTITWDTATACVSISGTSDGTVTGDELKTTISSYSRCAADCPQAGSDVDIVNETDNENVDIHFNGGRSATITASGPEATGQITIALACLN